MQMGGIYVRMRLFPHGVYRRRVFGAVFACFAVAVIVSPAVAEGSRQHRGPKNRVPPRIVGKPQIGVALRATRGGWTRPRPVVYEYRWFRCRVAHGKCRRIAGARRRRYTPSRQDVGMTLRVTVEIKNAAGFATASSRRTRVVRARRVISFPPVVTASPTVSGTPQEGQTLAATVGSWTGTMPISYTYQWESCDPSGLGCLPIANALSSVYPVTSADVGTTIRVLVTARNRAGTSSAGSAATAVVRARSTAPANASPPTIAGTAEAGMTLSALPGVWNGTQPIGYAYQWQDCDSTGRNCSPIAGATTSTYSVLPGDVGNTIRVLVAADNSAGTSSAVSAATAVVQAAPTAPANSSRPTITGIAQQGKTLTAGAGTWSGTQPIGYAYQWQRCDSSGGGCNPISGATATTYTATSTDVGHTIKVRVKATNVAGSANATSAATAIVLSAAVVALWHMDETSGSTMVDAVGGHNGTLYDVQLGLPGIRGTAYGFNGFSSYASVPSAATLNPGSANITITIHLQTTGTPPPAPADWDVFRKGLYTDGAEYKMELQSTGRPSCGFEGTGGYAELVAGSAINDGKWHTVSCVKTSTAIEVVVDGIVYSKAATVGSISNTTAVVIGARPGSDWFTGQLDEATIRIG